MDWFRKSVEHLLVRGSATHFYDLGRAHARKGEHHRAIADYSEAIRLNPYNADFFEMRGAQYRRIAQYDLAIADFDEAIKLDLKEASLFYFTSITSMIIEGPDRVRTARIHSRAWLFCSRGRARVERIHSRTFTGTSSYDAQGEHYRAIADYSEAIRLHQNRDFFWMRGCAYADQGQHTLAIADFDEVIAQIRRVPPGEIDYVSWQNSELRDAFYNRGFLHAENGDYDRAIADYTEAIRLDGLVKDSYFQDSYFQGRRDRPCLHKIKYDHAITDFDEAIKFHPKNSRARHKADYFFARGDAYAAKSSYGRALADYDEAIRLNPNFAEAIYSRAKIVARWKDESGRA
jgi:tetratricopeptide (TPR) repeat protein